MFNISSLPGKIKNIFPSFKVGNQWDSFVDNLSRELLIYDKDLSEMQKQHIFKKNIKLVEFEPNAFCNRKCSFCPNSILDRTNNRTSLDFECFKKVINDLALINYDQVIRFARYSEPLAAHNILEYISCANAALPEAMIDIVSNGDYLTRELLDKLKEAGLSTLRISIYPDNNANRWDHDLATSKVEQLSRRIKLKARKYNQNKDLIQWKIEYNGFDIFAEAKNLHATGLDRGQSMELLTDRTFERTSPCSFVFSNLTIDYNGSLMPCCNMLSEFKDHKHLIIDKITPDSSIYDLYFGEKSTNWRISLVSVQKKSPPCNTCKHKALTDKRKLNKLHVNISSKLKTLGLTPDDLSSNNQFT